jgi:hypothetical protein
MFKLDPDWKVALTMHCSTNKPSLSPLHPTLTHSSQVEPENKYNKCSGLSQLQQWDWNDAAQAQFKHIGFPYLLSVDRLQFIDLNFHVSVRTHTALSLPLCVLCTVRTVHCTYFVYCVYRAYCMYHTYRIRTVCTV